MKLKKINCLVAFLASAFQAFGMYNVHALSQVTEGGVLGLTLLLEHWFALSPAVSGFVLTGICYLIGWRTLGKEFIAYSAFAAAGATTGDDALAMSLSHVLKVPIQRIYLVSDLTVLVLSLSYIPVKRIAYSLLTVVLSGQIIGWIQNIKKKERLG